MAGGAQPEGTPSVGTPSLSAPPVGTPSVSTPSPDPDIASGAESPHRLRLGDPLDDRASEDRPEAWGERSEKESDRLARYRDETPPHHGA